MAFLVRRPRPSSLRSVSPGFQALISPFLLQLSTSSGNWAWQHQDLTQGILWAPNTFFLPHSVYSSWAGSIAPASVVTFFLPKWPRGRCSYKFVESILLDTRRINSPSEAVEVTVSSATSISIPCFLGLCALAMEGTAPYKGCQLKVKHPEGNGLNLQGVISKLVP